MLPEMIGKKPKQQTEQNVPPRSQKWLGKKPKQTEPAAENF